MIPDGAENVLTEHGVCRWCQEETEHTPAELVQMRGANALAPELVEAFDRAQKQAGRTARKWKRGTPGYDAYREREKERRKHGHDTSTR